MGAISSASRSTTGSVPSRVQRVIQQVNNVLTRLLSAVRNVEFQLKCGNRSTNGIDLVMGLQGTYLSKNKEFMFSGEGKKQRVPEIVQKNEKTKPDKMIVKLADKARMDNEIAKKSGIDKEKTNEINEVFGFLNEKILILRGQIMNH